MAVLQVAPAWETDSVPSELSAAEVRSVAVAPDGSVWVGVRDLGLARFDGAQVDFVAQSDGLIPAGVADLLVDRSGRLWVVGPGGYSVQNGDGWTGSSSTGHLTPRVLFSVAEDPRTGAIWMAGTAGAARWLDGAWTTFDSADGLPHSVVHAAHTDRTGVTWFGCRTGLARLEDGELEIMFPEVNIRSILESADGTLWFGTSDGVLSWDGSDWSHDLAGHTVYPRLAAADGSIWAGSASSGVLRHAAGTWTPIDLPDEFAGAEVFDLDQAMDGSIWVATSAGMLRLRLATQIGRIREVNSYYDSVTNRATLDM